MIVHITLGKLKLNKSNGVVNVVHNLALNQSKLKQIEVWGISDKNFSYDKRAYSLKIFKRSFLHFFSIKLLLNIIKNKKVKVYHLHGGWNFELIMISFMLSLLNKKYIVTPHGAFNSTLLSHKKYHQLLFYKTFVYFFLKKSYKVHVFSKNELDFLKSQFLDLKYCIVPNGIDTNHQMEDNSEIYDSNKTIFGYCGRLQNKHKAIDKLIDGFNYFLKKNEIQAELWLIGDGQDKNSLLKKVKELDIESKVVFFGALYGEKKNEILKKLDVFTLVSNYEGMPISALEAASFGQFLIVTDATNIASQVNKYGTGISINNNSPEEINRAINFYFQKNKSSKNFKINLQNNCKLMIQNEFNWLKISNLLIKHYDI